VRPHPEAIFLRQARRFPCPLACAVVQLPDRLAALCEHIVLGDAAPRFDYALCHGDQHLSTVLMHLMLLAFLIDQIQQRCCRLFQAAVTAAKSRTRLWRKLRHGFDLCLIPSWEAPYQSIIHPPQIALGHDIS
jgi:hypothetical protein